MKIAIDLQGIQSEGSRTRGIGRYSLEIIKFMIKGFQDYHFILVANAALNDLQIEFENELSFSNVTYFKWYSPGPIDYISKEINKTKIAINLRSYAFSCLDADIILITSFLEGFSDNCLVDFNKEFIKIPIVAIFYDLIPLINPKLYLNNNPQFAKYYKLKLQRLKQLDGLLAISHSSAKEAIKYLNYNKNSIFNISSACNKSIFNMTSKIDCSLSDIIIKYTPFILYSGASDPRKNIKRLLQAYSQLPNDLQNYKLVLVGKLLIPEVKLINQWVQDFRINPDNVYQTGYISDSDLVCLYRKCALFVFPSLHEGFGLPILEAMSCGAPVIGSNTTSIPEVIGLENAMFDPYDVNQISDLIIKSLTNSEFYEELKLNSSRQSKLFSWRKTAALAINSLEYFVNNNKVSHDKTYNSVLSTNKIKLDLLIKNITLCSPKIFSFDKEFYSQIAASIDKIDIQINHFNRHTFSKNKNLSWKVEGPFDSSYSLAILNRCFVETLQKNISSVALHITEGFGDYLPDMEYLKQYPKILSIFQDSIKDEVSHDVLSRNLYPPRVNDMNAQYNLLHSYGWEESAFPFEWVKDFNAYLQGITVMSSQVKKILIDNGVTLPITVCGLGLDHLNKVEVNSKYILEAKKYKFLHISSCFPRKGIDILIRAFVDTFTNKDDVSLIIKTFNNQHNNVDQILAKLKEERSNMPDIVLIKGDLSLSEIRSLYSQSDVLVAPSRGEGFGLPIAEAMLMNIPVITTNWGGQTDFCQPDNCWLIDYDFVLSKSHFNLSNSYWAEPSVNHLSKLLLDVYLSSDSEIEQKTLAAKNLIKSFTWDSVVDKNVYAINNDFCRIDNIFSKVGWISTWHSKCGIASYSRRFINYMPDDIFVFSPFDEVKNNPQENINLLNDQQLIPSWNYPPSKHQNLDYLFQKIISHKISSLIIQFNFGFFDVNQLVSLIDKLSACKINIIIFLHSTTNTELESSNYLLVLKKSLEKCTRIFVHTVTDINRLKKIDLVDNVSLITHPIIDFKDSVNKLPFYKTFNYYNKKQLRIVSYGFCLPDKGFLELIQAISILRTRNILLRLDIYSAIYSEDYYFVFQELVDLVSQLKLNDIVKLHPQYISEDQLLSTLSKYDLVVFPYQRSNESSSASIRDGLATLKPVIATPLSIFDDVHELVDFFPGISPDEIADGLVQWITKLNQEPETVMETRLSRINKIKKLVFSEVSQRLSLIIKSLEINK